LTDQKTEVFEEDFFKMFKKESSIAQKFDATTDAAVKSIGAISCGTIGGATGAIIGTFLLPGAGTILFGIGGAAVGGTGGFKLGKFTGKMCIKTRKMGSKVLEKSKKKEEHAQITERTLLIGDIEWDVQAYNATVTNEEEPIYIKIENIIQTERLSRNYSINRRNAIRKKRSI